MKLLSVCVIFICVLIVKCDEYDFESIEKNIIKPLNCDLNCLDKKDPSNSNIITNIYKYFGIKTEDDILKEEFLKKELDNVKKKNTVLLKNLDKAYRFYDAEFFPSIVNQYYPENNYARPYFKETCQFSNSYGIFANLNMKTEIPKKIRYVDVNYLLYYSNISARQEELFIENAIEKHCDPEFSFFKSKNMTKNEYCN